MKTIKLIPLTIAFVCATVLLSANPLKDKEENTLDSKYTIFQDKEIVNLVYQPQSAKVKIYLYNAKDELIYVDRVKSKEIFYRPYNFSGLKAGNYTFKIVENNRNLSHEIQFRHSKGNKSQSSVMVDLLPLQNERYNLTVIGYHKPIVKVNIYNRTDNLIYSEDIHQTAGFKKVYNLEELPTKSYRFEILVDNQKINKYIN